MCIYIFICKYPSCIAECEIKSQNYGLSSRLDCHDSASVLLAGHPERPDFELWFYPVSFVNVSGTNHRLVNEPQIV